MCVCYHVFIASDTTYGTQHSSMLIDIQDAYGPPPPLQLKLNEIGCNSVDAKLFCLLNRGNHVIETLV